MESPTAGSNQMPDADSYNVGMTTQTAFNPHQPTSAEDRLAVEICLHKILDAAKFGDAEGLASHHLYGPKFTKYDDMEPLHRQEAEEARTGEDGITQVDNFAYRVDDLRIDVFGPAAIATFMLDYAFDAEGDHIQANARSTLVFVLDGNDWKIAHEHLSPSA
jgi:ketosteroid isomerase-like protein